MPAGTVYVGRGSRWGNPFKVGAEYVRRRMDPGGGQRSGIVVDQAHAVRLFSRFTARECGFQEAVEALRGRDLACWCRLCDEHRDGKPLGVKCVDCAPCHVEPLLDLANR